MKRLIIIGAGPGGYECAVRAAKSGLEVHVIDSADHLGGTCLNEGCIPTKCLCHSAEIIDTARQMVDSELREANSPIENETAQGEGMEVCYELPPDRLLAKALHRKDEIVKRLREGIATLMTTPGITLHNGRARFAPGDPHTVIVGDEQLKADYVMIATGSVPRLLPIPGADTVGVLTSDQLLSLDKIRELPERVGKKDIEPDNERPCPFPERLCIIGGGVIGLEFASIFNTLGSSVTVIEYCKEILPGFDRDLAKRLRTALKRRGVEFITGAPVTAIHADSTRGGELHVSYEHRNSVKEKLADLVLMAVGRQANLDSLNLAEAGIDFTPKGIATNDNLMTNVEGIYAVGDINGRCQLAHAATFQSYKALAHLLGKTDETDLNIMPAAVFTVPEAAMVGLTEEQANERGIEVTVHKAFYRSNGRALSMDAADEGLVKLIADANGHLVGAHILGAHAAELIHELALAIKLHATLDQLRHCVHAHPTLSEIVWQAAES